MVVGKFIDECRFTIKDNIIYSEVSSKGVTNQGLSKSILNNFNRYPDCIGQINTKTGEVTTFAEFKDRCVRCAVWLKKQGIGKNDVVCTSTPLENDDYVPFLATFFVGAIINPWYHELTPAMATYFFGLTEPKIMFASEQSIEMLVAAAKEAKVNCTFVVFGNHPDYRSLKDLMAQQSQNEVDNFSHVEPDEPNKHIGGMFFSSGTTGIQKCAMFSDNALLNNRTNYTPVYEGTNMLWYSSFSWITGAICFITCIMLRCTRILHPEFDPEETSTVIKNFKVNWSFITPTMMAQLVYKNVFETYDYSTLKVLVTGGSKPNKQILENTRTALPHTSVLITYGMTELGGLATIQRKNCQVVDSVGYVIGELKAKVIDRMTNSKLGPNQPGEICFKLESMMIGYLKNDEETKIMIDEDGWLHTGDMGYYSESGEIVILDRIKRVIITQNYHVSPSQIEEILLQHPAVKDAAVISVPHKIDIERPLAFVVKKPGAEVEAEELIDLPTIYNEYFRLTGGVIFIDEMSYTPNGKTNIRELKEKARAEVTKKLIANN